MKLTIDELDVSTPESFALSVLPWLQAETGLKLDTTKVPLPFPVLITDKPIPVDSGKPGYAPLGAAGLYDYRHNELIVACMANAPGEYTCAIVVHELVHYLQNVNGWFDKNSGKTRYDVERMAYDVQSKFFREVLNVNPAYYGHDPVWIEKCLQKERELELEKR